MRPELLFSLAFNLLTKKFILTDQTDYVGEVIDPSKVKGIIIGTGPSGVFYTGTFTTPDIDPNVSPNSPSIDLPTESDYVEQGDYAFKYEIAVTGQVFDLPIILIEDDRYFISGNYLTILEGLTAASLRDSGGIVIDASITISNVAYNTSEDLTSFDVSDASTLPVVTDIVRITSTYNESLTQGFNFDFTYPEVCIETLSECDCSTLEITDQTVYPSTNGTVTSSTRAFTANYPQGIVPAISPVESALQSFRISPIYTGTWVVEMTNAIVYQYNTILTVNHTVSGIKEHLVDCEDSLCSMFECITNLTTKYNKLLTYNARESFDLQNKLIKIFGAFTNYSIAKKCGYSSANSYLAIIKDTLSDCGCGCTDTTGPQQVVPYCQNAIITTEGTIIFESANNGIKITSITVGTTTTYTFSLDQLVLKQIILDTVLDNVRVIDLLDVDPTGLVANTILKYNGTKYVVTSYSLASLNDTNISTPLDGHYLGWDSGTQRWINKKVTIAQLGDVTLTGLADGFVLIYDIGTSKWVAVDSSTLGATTLAALTDTTITTPANQNTLIYDSITSKWVNVDNTLWNNFDTADYAPSYANFGTPYNVLQYKINVGRKSISIRGAFENTVSSPIVDVLVYTIANPSLRPIKTVSLVALDTLTPNLLMIQLNAAGELVVLGGHPGGAAMNIVEQEISLN
jgi:hypothetical protein